MKSLRYFNTIHISPPLKEIYRRLGFQKGVTKIDRGKRGEVEKGIEYALSLILLKGAGRRLAIKEMDLYRIVLEGGVRFESVNLVQLFEGCKEVLLVGATAGSEILEAIKNDMSGNNLTRAVMLDAVASEMVDASLDWIINYFSHEISRENKVLMKRRFSAGYGDFSLINQKIIYDILKLDHIGVTINERYILIPEKSVTAVVGIKSKERISGEE